MAKWKAPSALDFPFKFLLLLLFFVIAIAIALLCAEEYMKAILNDHILQAERTQTYTVMLLAQIISGQIIFHYLCGFPIAHRCNRDLFTSHLVLLMKIWILVCLTSVFQLILLALVLLKTRSSLSEALALELHKGLKRYRSDPEWRLIWDSIQIHRQCCGIYDFHDWAKARAHELRPEDRLSTSILSFIPFSCCQNQTHCYRNILPILLHDKEINVPDIDTSVINMNGCLYHLVDECRFIVALILSATIAISVLFVLIVITLRCAFFAKREFHDCDSTEDEDAEPETTTIDRD